MDRVDLYAESDSISQISIERRAVYVLEFVSPGGYITTETEGVRGTGTYHQIILDVLGRALGRMRRDCEVHIHTQDNWLLNAAERDLQGWARSGFTTKAGKPLANREQWERFYSMTMEEHHHLIVPEHGGHAYYGWMQAEMRRSRQKDTWEPGVWVPLDS